jgi:FkbM family methyltransferase
MDLVFDIGANDGADTAYYLYKGFRVVAVEANPTLADHLRARFAGQPVTVLNVGIADSEGEMTFWVCNEQSEWSSFDLAGVQSKGGTAVPFTVDTAPLTSLLDEFGTPLYCKIDIEGYDKVAVRSFSPENRPKFMSIEMSYGNGDQDLDLLSSVGYSQFKIVSQVTRKQPWPVVFWLQAAMPWRVRTKLQTAERLIFGKARHGSYAFPPNSSGPFGSDLPGRWLSKQEAMTLWRSLHKTANRFGAAGDWFDIHATA